MHPLCNSAGTQDTIKAILKASSLNLHKYLKTKRRSKTKEHPLGDVWEP